MAAITIGREQIEREVARLAYGFGLEAERTGLLKELGKKKYRKLKRKMKALMGLALTEEAGGYLEQTRHRMKLEELHKPPSGR